MRRVFILAALLLLSVSAFAQVTSAPSLLNFQGRLTRPDGTPVADDTYSIRFSLHDAASGGNEKWRQALNSVTVRNGTFAVILNLTSGFTAGNDLRTALNGNTYLEIKVGSDAPLMPRQRLASVAYALRANGVADGSITSDSLASNALNNLSWLLTGNSISNPATQFLGTTSNQPLAFRTNNTEKMRLLANGNLGLGVTNPSAKLEVNGTTRTRMMEVIGGSDVAEPYHIAAAGKIHPLPGMVVAIHSAKIGQMRVASKAYDRTVAGIISGANGIRPGITLRQEGTVADGTLPVASLGRVWCWCDADANGSIEPGDRLTTSKTPGHAMKVTNAAKADGAIIGKAMSSLKKGKGLVLVLVSLK